MICTTNVSNHLHNHRFKWFQFNASNFSGHARYETTKQMKGHVTQPENSLRKNTGPHCSQSKAGLPDFSM
jgi:hypothetical protein